jgi:hypothetical protein
MSGFIGTFEGKKCYVDVVLHSTYIYIGNSSPVLIHNFNMNGEFYWHLMFEAIDWKEL